MSARVLVTSGATREPVDGVRFLTNFSTGGTGAALADGLAERGFAVTYLHGRGARMPSAAVAETSAFDDFRSLDAALRDLLGARRWDAVIHLAAVSDYSVAGVSVDGGPELPAAAAGKLSSDAGELRLRLRRNFKIVDRLKDYARAGGAPRIVAFKLTNTGDARERGDAVARLLERPGVDLVVHNDLGQIRSGAPHRFTVHSRAAVVAEADGPASLAQALVPFLTEPRRN